MLDSPSIAAGRGIPRRLWRIAGGFALAHVVLLFAGLSQQAPVSMADGPESLAEVYGGADLIRVYAGGLIELFGFLCLLVSMVFVARAVGRRTEAARWAAQVGLLAGVAYIASTFATGMPAGAASLYALHHGVDVETAFSVNNVRLFAYFVSLMLLGLSSMAIGVGALVDRYSPRWVGWGGIVTGLALFTAPALASIAQQDLPTLVWLVWWVGLAIGLLRHREAAESPRTPADELAVRHA